MGVLRGLGRPSMTSNNGDNEDSDDESFLVIDQNDILALEQEQELQDFELIPTRESVPVPPPSPKKSKRNRKCPKGHRLTLKKGRRSKLRYENEKLLFEANEDVDDEDWLTRGIVPDTRSRFRDLLKQDQLLDQYLNEEEGQIELKEQENDKLKKRKRLEGLDDFASDPERAYLRVAHAIRGAIKKHWPRGMIEGLEDEIRTFFTENPEQEYVKSDLSSYERLLAHACSSYHDLVSKSFDGKSGVRMLMIENPRPTFNPIDPSLSQYLDIRQKDCKSKREANFNKG